MQGRNKIILSIYSLHATIILLTGLVRPSMNWKEKIAVTGFMFVSVSFVAFILYVLLHKKNQREPRCNIVAKIFWKKYRKPFTLSYYFADILIAGTSVFSMTGLSFAWKSGVFAILVAVISGSFFVAYQAANQMLDESCVDRIPAEE